MSGGFVAFSCRRLPLAGAALIIAIPLASGACVHLQPHNAGDLSFASASARPPSRSLAPRRSVAGERSAGYTASLAGDAIASSDLVASNDDPEIDEESSVSTAPSTWATPSNANVSEGSSTRSLSSTRRTWMLPGESIVSPQPTPPLAGDLESLPVAGHPDTWVSLPTGATSRRPVVVVIHGAGDRPERQCRGWRHAASEYPFVICPTGRAWPRYTHIGGAPLLEYIDEALATLAERYPDYVDTRAPLLVGFSLGASQVTALAAQFPARFSRIALVEGATKAWSTARASAFLQGGGQRVLFACGQDGVRDRAERVAKRLAKLGIDTHVVYANVGHKFGPPLQDVVGSELAWLMQGDERWPATP